jgi:hypothetical protein
MPYRSFGCLLERRRRVRRIPTDSYIEGAQGVQHRVDSAQLYVCTRIRSSLSLKIRLSRPFPCNAGSAFESVLDLRRLVDSSLPNQSMPRMFHVIEKKVPGILKVAGELQKRTVTREKDGN